MCVCVRAGDGEENKKNMNNETHGYIVLSSLRNKREGSRFTMVFVQLVNIVRYSFIDNDINKVPCGTHYSNYPSSILNKPFHTIFTSNSF